MSWEPIDRQRRIESSDRAADLAARHAEAAAESARQVVDLYGKPRKTTEDWSRISELARLTDFGLKAADVHATLALRQAYLVSADRAESK